MHVEGNAVVFVILGVAFAAVGIHLILWSRRQARLIRRFALTRGLDYQTRDPGDLEAEINQLAELDEPGRVRSFGRIRDILVAGRVRIFRTVELLDLDSSRQVESPHHARTMFIVPTFMESSGIFEISPQLNVRRRYPPDQTDTDTIQLLLERSGIPAPPCPLSLSFTRGHALGYLLPTVTGALTTGHLDYLVDCARRLEKKV